MRFFKPTWIKIFISLIIIVYLAVFMGWLVNFFFGLSLVPSLLLAFPVVYLISCAIVYFKPTRMSAVVWLLLNITLIVGFIIYNFDLIFNIHQLEMCHGWPNSPYPQPCFDTLAAFFVPLEFAAVMLVLNPILYLLSCVIVSITHKLKRQEKSRKH